MSTKNEIATENSRTKVHFTYNELLNPTNPVSVNLIGAGGTGSQMLTALARMNHALVELNHAVLSVRLWDDDVITEANLGRQLFAESELGLHKSVALINRTNRFFGTDWKAETQKFKKDYFGKFQSNMKSEIYISCVDSVKSRFEIAEILNELKIDKGYHRNQPKYWMDFGNSQFTGQVFLSTIGNIRQPNSEIYKTVQNLPFVTEEFGELLKQSETEDNTPSCSLAEALEKQDLFINSTLAQMGSSLLWDLFRNGLIESRGFFLNLKNFHSQPIKL
ncbi:PRTRC system ThiF family protein [Chryseobacterium aquaticum]|uniref:PRTRC system ThiF family protein n=1 Tax=Chryseobacterium aquaticum TaxID=452084 RepID=A0A848N5F3_9FLAO|nr:MULTISPECIES: PRTRC system ThiF family protein [Chryseobacterium]NMR34222.1 PRTRC system ThiF family protein [Chryseobacterium aquaticum]NRQ46297.1 PRTRC system ThiF family protein [Chryseobacterium sp. C-204]